jgi:hypothetical protein
MAGTIIVDRIESDASYASSINVAAQVTFSNTAIFNAGNVSRPSISFSGNTSTGMYMPLANTIAWTVAGSEAVRIDSAGNVGIGTNSPSYRLDVGNASVSGNIHTFGSNVNGTLAGYSIRGVPRLTNDTGTLENTYIGCGASVGNIIFQQGNSFTTASNTERMRITSAGVVQVGNNAGTGEVFAQNTVKAWGVIIASSGALYNSFGISSSSKISTGLFQLNFTRTLSSSRFGSGTNPYGGGFAFINTESTTGFRINVNNTSNTYVDSDVMFLIAGGS